MNRTMAQLLLAGSTLVGGVAAQQTVWGQCGGIGWSPPTNPCARGSACSTLNSYYAQCIRGATSIHTSTRPPSGPTTTTRATSTTSSTPPTSSGDRWVGVNVAGFDFGCSTDGTCVTSKVYHPLKNFTGSNNYPDGIGQMQHFVNDDGMTIPRLRVGWQYLVTNNLGGALDRTSISKFDQLDQGCLSHGVYCIVDIHNYFARWNGGIIGQGGPTNAQFTSHWSQLASKYAFQSRVWFGINEPHAEVNMINTSAGTVQEVVTAIRNAGATSQYISLPGANDSQSAAAFISDGSAAALSQVTSPDESTTNLIFDVHKYSESDNSGTQAECTTNNNDGAFAPPATWLRPNNRQAILTATGGGNDQSCIQYLCQPVQYLNQNSDVYLGYVGWGAGSLDNTYELTETPTGSGNSWTDTSLVSSCLARK
uniref:Endoglucanase EG-II n=1 Tax=Clonostachys rosea f. catenulata TaxID=62888 RepID=I3QKR7_BIOOC|nr:putative endoglucanase [Clonostachys rosea f. catenulata]